MPPGKTTFSGWIESSPLMVRAASTALVLAAILASAGCVREERQEDGIVNVRAPGVQVRVGQDGGTSVRAPGVRVQAGPESVEVASPKP